MFSGIVREIGTVASLDGPRLRVDAPRTASRLAPDDSVAVNGVCLTAVALGNGAWFESDLSPETLRITTLGQLTPGARVNLEPALRLGDPLGGHMVPGHVEGVGQIERVEPLDNRCHAIRIRLPAGIIRYVVTKGFVAIDGISLTVKECRGARLEVVIIPRTREATICAGYRVGTQVNVETDVSGRYFERFAQAESGAARTQV